MGDVKKELEQVATKPKAGTGAWVPLVTLIIILLNAFRTSESTLKAMDFMNLCGSFGQIGDTGANFIGKGRMGAKGGSAAGLDLIPAVMFFCGIVGAFEQLGAPKVSDTLFRSILKPMLNTPSKCGVTFISSFTGLNAAAVMTKELTDNDGLTNNEGTAFVAYQYAGSACIDNTTIGGAPLIAIRPMALGSVTVIKFVCKLVGTNLVRLILKASQKKRAQKWKK